jgi:hypothetical protein
MRFRQCLGVFVIFILERNVLGEVRVHGSHSIFCDFDIYF